MTQDHREEIIPSRTDVLRMAREAGFTDAWVKPLERFAALVAAHEREACAQVCDWILMDTLLNVSNDYQEGRDMGVVVCAAAIRARGEE